MMTEASAPVENLFNCHKWCDHQWCWAKELESKKLELVTVNMKSGEENLEVPIDKISPPPPPPPPNRSPN